MKIYIACGLTHVPRHLFTVYVDYLHSLAETLRGLDGVFAVRYALIDSDPQLGMKPARDRPALCYAWDRRMVEDSDLVVADASFPSTGLGIEMQIAESAGIPVIMLIGDYGVNRVKAVHYENPDHSEHDLQIGEGIVSLMALGLPAICKTVAYATFENAIVEARSAVAGHL